MQQTEAKAGEILGRGAGWGALLGAVFGFFIVAADDLLTFHDDPFSWFSLYVGLLTAPFGMLYGAVAGLVAAACVLPFSAVRSSANAARIVTVIVGPGTVALISFIVFRPSMNVGANETSDHVTERFVLFYGYPCASAFLASVFFGSRLTRPSTWSTP